MFHCQNVIVVVISKSCSDIDKVVEDIVKKGNMSERATQNRIARWHTLVKKDVETIYQDMLEICPRMLRN